MKKFLIELVYTLFIASNLALFVTVFGMICAISPAVFSGFGIALLVSIAVLTFTAIAIQNMPNPSLLNESSSEDIVEDPYSAPSLSTRINHQYSVTEGKKDIYPRNTLYILNSTLKDSQHTNDSPKAVVYFENALTHNIRRSKENNLTLYIKLFWNFFSSPQAKTTADQKNPYYRP